jgi:hypothetical protein
MRQEKLPGTFEFLKDKIYLPGYMVLRSAECDSTEGEFLFNPIEPPVAKVVNYLTPRGVHIFASQAGYIIAEQLAREGKLEERDIQMLRDTFLDERIRIYWIGTRFRKEVNLGGLVRGMLKVTKLRLGKSPILQIDYEIGERAVKGDFSSTIMSRPVPQLNQDILRFNTNERKYN